MPRPLRFAMVTTFYPPYNFGGDGIFVQRLSRELASRGHQVTVIHNADAYCVLSGVEPSAHPEEESGITVHTLRSRFPAISLLAVHQSGGPWFYSRDLKRLLSADFDVIHFHNVSLMGAPAVLTMGRGLKLYTMHEYWLVCPTHVMFRRGRAACEDRDCWTCSMSYGRPPQLWRYTSKLKNAARSVDMFLAPSQFLACKHLELGLDFPITVLPNFVPGSADAEPAEGRWRAKPYFLSAGRLERIKGLETLLPVFQRFAAARLVVAGGGSGEAELRHRAAGCANIEFLGHVSGLRLRELYRGAAAVIVPSLNYESCPLVALEACSEHTPVIARGIGSLSEIVETGGGFTYRTDEELIRAMNALLGEPDLRRSRGRQAREAWVRHWSPEAHIQRYLGLIRELQEQHQSPAVQRMRPACQSNRP